MLVKYLICSCNAHTYLPELSILGVQVGSEFGLVVEKQGVIRSEHHSARDAIRVVHVVEGVGRHGVQGDNHIRFAILGTHLLQMQGVIRIQRRVHAIRRAREVVEAGSDLRAARSADSMCTCIALHTSSAPSSLGQFRTNLGTSGNSLQFLRFRVGCLRA